MKFMINCDEATTICDKNQYGEATLSEKVRLTLHLFICKYCKSYSKQNKLMSRIFGRHLSSCDSNARLSEEEKLKLEKHVLRELKKK